jgi:hypothetical protein
MDFLAPLMLIGALGAGVPIALHLIGRRRARRVRFAAIDFLLGSDRRLARSSRLRERLLLVARVAACLALAAGLSKPITSCADDGPEVRRGPQAAVIVLDDALGAEYRIGGERVFDRARREARRILTQLGPEAEVAVVTTARPSDAAAELSRDHIRLRDHIDATQPTARPADLTGALRRAERLLAASNHAGRTIYLVSTLPAIGLVGEPPWPAGTGPHLVVIDPSDGAALDNAAVTALEVAPDAEAGPRGVRVTAELTRSSASAAPVEREVRLELGGELVARGVVELVPGRPTRKTFSAVLPAGVRVAEVAVALVPDALPLDDRRHALAGVRAAIPVLLVDGDPRTVRHDDELFYLRSALRPGDRDDAGVELTTATEDELGKLELERFDVIALCNARALAPVAAARLGAWVRAGGGLLLTMGEQVDPDAWNRTMAGVLPQPLATVIDTGFGKAGGERAGQALRLDKLELEHPIFTPFGKDAGILAGARFRKVVLLGPSHDGTERRVLARYDNGAVALVEVVAGDGRALLYTSTIDRDWTDLPLQPGFLPLVQQIARYLAKKPAGARRGEVRVGEQVMLEVPAGEERLEVVGPRGARAVFDREELADRRQVRYADTARPGIYRVIDVAGGARREREESAFAVNLDPRGSDLTRAPAGALQGGPGTDEDGAGATEHRRRIELWHAIAAALLLFLFVESALLVRA